MAKAHEAERGRRKSNVPMYVATLVGLALYAVGTYVVVEVAGGTEIRETESNTPTHTVPGPPGIVPTPNPWFTVQEETGVEGKDGHG